MAKPKTLAELLAPYRAPLDAIVNAAQAKPAVPKKTVTVKRTPAKTTVRKTDTGGGGDFGPSGKAVNAPPPSPIEKIATAVMHTATEASRTLIESAADQAVPHRPDKPPKQPKQIFPAVKQPSPEQSIYQAQANRLALQLPALTKTLAQRQSATKSVRDQIDTLIKSSGKLDKKTGKTTLEPDDYKRFEALSRQLKAAGDRQQEATKAHNDVITRVYELDRAYKQNTPSPIWAPKAPALRPSTLGIERRPAFDFGGTPAGIPGLTPRKGGPLLPALERGEEKGGLLSNIIEGTVETAGRVGKSLLPVNSDWSLDTPELLQRMDALGATATTGIIEGSKGAYNIVRHQIEHDRRRGDYTQKKMSTERKLGRPLTSKETQALASGMGVNLLEAGPLDVQNFKNFAAGAAGIGAGAWTDPVAVAKDIAKLTVDATVGTGLFVAALSRPDLTYDQRKAMLAEMPKGIKDEYVRHFGRGLSMFEAFERAKDEPISTALLYPTPLAGATQGARVLTIMRFGLKGGLSPKEAIRLARDPEKMRTLTYTERAPKGSGVETVRTKVPVPYGYSSSVAFRNVAQRPYDVATRAMDVIPGARRLPIAMSNRAARALGKEVRMTKTRRGAEVQAHYQNIEQFLNERDRFGRKKNKHLATTMAVLVQKPKGFTDDEWERAVIQNMKDMLADPERMDLPGDTVTPAEQKLINRIKAYDKRAESARASKRGLTMRRLYQDQQRWGENLARITREREDLHDEWLAHQDNDVMMDAGWDDENARLEGGMKALDSEAQVMREHLAEISVDQPPILSPRRTQFRQQLEKLDYFNDHPEAIEDALLAGDAAARSWARAKSGRSPAEWWELRDVRGADENDIPLEAYAQDGGREQRLIENLAAQQQLARMDPKPDDYAQQVKRLTQEREDILRADEPGDVRRQERETDIPDPSGLKLTLERTLTPEKAAQNLRRVKGGDLYRPESGHVTNRKSYRTINGERTVVFGDITPEEWVQRQRVLIPDPAERDKLARWYGEVAPTFERFFGEDADAILRGFAVSQANASPAGGLQAVMRIFDKIKRGETVGKNDASVVSESIAAALRGEHVSKGLAAKLHDFTDSIQGKSTRTWMGDDPDGGWPVANDVHAIRDLGYIDKKIVNRLLKPEAGALFSRGFRESDFKVDSGGSPGTHQYERMREKYEAITEHLNDIVFDGRRDWNPSQVQALGWSSIQRLHGTTPEDLLYAVRSNTRRLNLEVTKAGDDLSLGEAAAVARAVEPAIRDIVDGVDGLYWDRDIDIGVTATKGSNNATLSFDVIGSPEKTHALVVRLADVFDQEVRATREISSAPAKPTLLVWHPDLADSDKALALQTALFTADKKKFAGRFATTEEDGVPAISFILPGKVVTKAEHDNRLKELQELVDGAVDEVLGDVDYDLRLANTQTITKEWKGGKGTQRRVARTRSERALDDSLDAQARQRKADALDAVRAGQEEPGLGVEGRVLNQTRRTDTLGATQLLNSATGERIIWLTEHADFSTVMHELLGHAAEEMKDLHPEEFAAVERAMGKGLDQWVVEDHEKFATWFERYLYEGHAPTPEMVPVFDRSKQYMRVIYGPLRQQLGGRIPQETRDLFDHYLGGWDSESSSRIAVNMGHFDPSDSPWAGARMAAQGELETLQKRNRTRRFNQTVEGMMEKLKVLEKKADQASEPERELLAAEILRTQAEIVLRSDKRVKNLTSKISDMEKALTRDPSNRRFSGALESAKFMMEDRERILREAFGEENFDEMFSNRRDLLANYLVQHGLLQPDFEHGTGTYFPMKLDEGFLQSLKLPMTAASNRVIGKTQTSMVGLHHRNEMIRWQAGDWSADPAVLQLAHARAMSYQFVLEVRELMHAMGRELTAAERRDPKLALPDGGYVVNLAGTPLSPDMKAATRGMTNTTTVDNLDDGLFGDNEKLEATLKDFFRNSIVDLDDMPPGFSLADDNLRFISKGAVNKIFRPVSLNLGGRYFDWLNTAARFSLIYANMPGYMITNLAGNLVFLTAQQGLNWIPRWVHYGKMLKSDDYFRARVSAEGGMLPAYSAITRGRNFTQMSGEKLRAGERWWLGIESKVDEWPRMVAWMAEANKKGYWSKESMLRLLDGKTEKTRRDREYVAERTNQTMIDFTYRVSDRERAVLGRLFFIWPYVRGATALPFWYGKNYPARTALIAQLALQQRQYQESILGDLPPGREDLYAYSREGSRGVGAGAQANVLGTRYFNPAGPVPDEIQMASDLVASAFGRKPDNLSARLSSLLNVNVENTIGLFTGRDAFGRDISLKDQILNPYGIADSLVPFLRYARAAFSDEYVPRAFREGEGDTAQERIFRNVIRVPQQTVSVDWLNASASSRGEKTTEQKIAEEVVANQKHFHKIEGAGEHYPRTLRKQVAARVIFEDRVADLEREQAAKAGHIPKQKDDGTWDFGYTADEYDKSVIAWEVMRKQFPEVLSHHDQVRTANGLPPLSSPNEKLAEARVPPRSEGGKKYAQVYLDIFDTVLKSKPDEQGIKWAEFYDTRYEKLIPIERYKAEKKAGVYKGREAALKAKRAKALREYGNG